MPPRALAPLLLLAAPAAALQIPVQGPAGAGVWTTVAPLDLPLAPARFAGQFAVGESAARRFVRESIDAGTQALLPPSNITCRSDDATGVHFCRLEHVYYFDQWLVFGHTEHELNEEYAPPSWLPADPHWNSFFEFAYVRNISTRVLSSLALDMTEIERLPPRAVLLRDYNNIAHFIARWMVVHTLVQDPEGYDLAPDAVRRPSRVGLMWESGKAMGWKQGMMDVTLGPHGGAPPVLTADDFFERFQQSKGKMLYIRDAILVGHKNCASARYFGHVCTPAEADAVREAVYGHYGIPAEETAEQRQKRRTSCSYIARTSGTRALAPSLQGLVRRWATMAGFTVYDVRMGDYTFAQQVEVMSRTGLLLGVHGADFTNAMWMRPGSVIVEIFPPYFLWDSYFKLARLFGLHHMHYSVPARADVEYPAGAGNVTVVHNGAHVPCLELDGLHAMARQGCFSVLRDVDVIGRLGASEQDSERFVSLLVMAKRLLSLEPI